MEIFRRFCSLNSSTYIQSVNKKTTQFNALALNDKPIDKIYMDVV